MPRMYLWAVLLAIAVLGGIAVRSIGFTNPYALDFHSWRQGDTAAFTHGYLTTTLNPFDPRVDRYPCEHRDMPFGRVEAELPVVSWLAALPLAAMGVKYPPAPYLRAVSILFYMGTCIYLFLLVFRLGESRMVAATSVLVFSALPLSMYFTRTIQPDGPALFFSCGLLYHLTRWVDSDQKRHDLLSAVFASLAFLQKISTGYLLFPVLYLIISTCGWKRSVLTVRYWVWGIAILCPVVAWYAYASKMPWTFGIWNDKYSSFAQLYDLGVWRVFSERLTFEILTWSGVALLCAGFTKIAKRRAVRVAAVWLAAIAAFIALSIPANITHIYYQLPIVVPASIIIAVAIVQVYRHGWTARLALVGAAAIYVLTARDVLRGYHKYDSNGLDQTVDLLRASVPAESYIVSTDRDPRLYYNAGVRGWFVDTLNLDALKQCMGQKARFLLLNEHLERDIVRGSQSLSVDFNHVGSAGGYSLWVKKADSLQIKH